MRIVILILILLFSSSVYATSLEDGLRIRLNYSIKNNINSTPHETTMEFIETYLDTLKYKEFLDLSTLKAEENKDNLTEAKIQAQINSNKKTALEKITKIYFVGNNRKILDRINYSQAKSRLGNTLHVEINNVKLPLIPKTPQSLEEALLLALKSRGLNQQRDKNSLFAEKIDSTIEEVTQQWEKFNNAQKEYIKTETTKREMIKINYKYRVATYNLLATNYDFINKILSKNSSLANNKLFIDKKDDNIMNLHFKEKIKKKPVKKNRQIKKSSKIRTTMGKKETVFCFKVNTDILNVRKEHSEKSIIVHRYNKGDIICASTQSFSWIKTEYGWCSKDYLIRVKSEL